MNIILFIIVFVQILINTECRKNQARILNSEKSFAGEFPFVVAILGHNYFMQCTGTLVAWKKVITAAHCVEYCLAGENYGLSIYYAKPMKAGQKRKIVSDVIHPEAEKSYKTNKRTSTGNDIAIITVDRPFIETHSVALIELGTKQVNKEPCIAIGFGSMIINNLPSEGFLRSATVEIIDKSAAYNNLYIVGPKDNVVTHGDSGSPLVDSEMNIIYGVCCGRAYDKSASYYVNVAQHKDWIMSHVGESGEFRSYLSKNDKNSSEIIKVSISSLFFLSSIQLFFMWLWNLYLI